MGQTEFRGPIETKTWEIEEIKKDASGYIDHKILYRIWKLGNGDWKVHINEMDGIEPEAIRLPKEVVDLLIKESVRDDLKKK